jgi:CDP-diglyceride synthetase
MIFEIHARLGNTAFYYAAIMALWGIYRMIRKQGVDSTYWFGLVIAEILVVLQGVFGIYLRFFTDIMLANQIHILFGALSGLVIPVAFALTRFKKDKRDMIIYGATFILMVATTALALKTAGQLLIFE